MDIGYELMLFTLVMFNTYSYALGGFCSNVFEQIKIATFVFSYQKFKNFLIAPISSPNLIGSIFDA
jgi:hypothetical protein